MAWGGPKPAAKHTAFPCVPNCPDDGVPGTACPAKAAGLPGGAAHPTAGISGVAAIPPLFPPCAAPSFLPSGSSEGSGELAPVLCSPCPPAVLRACEPDPRGSPSRGVRGLLAQCSPAGLLLTTHALRGGGWCTDVPPCMEPGWAQRLLFPAPSETPSLMSPIAAGAGGGFPGDQQDCGGVWLQQAGK